MLRVSEMFYSLQGEGSTMGKPSVFLRLTGCNLLCGNPQNKDYSKPGPGATWICDTIPVWLQGKKYVSNSLLDEFRSKGFISKIKQGAHLIITGGEPLQQQEDLESFLELLAIDIIGTLRFGTDDIFIEIETNGTIMPTWGFNRFVRQYNCSPKLANSGMSKEKRYNIKTLIHLKSKMTIFKFVISNKEDMEEVMKDFIEPFSIKNENVYLMPGADNRKDLNKLEPMIAEMCKEYGFNYSTRMHIQIWDKKTGV